MKRFIPCGVLHVNDASRDSTSPTMRIAKFVAEELGCPLIHDLTSAKQHEDVEFGVLYVKYGMLKFSEHRDQALKIHDAAKYVVNLENDYTFKADRRFKPANETWSTVEGRTRYVNWNVLTRMPLVYWALFPGGLPTPSEKGVVYYGAMREGRVPYFKKYFDEALYPVTISSFRGGKKFAELCRGVKTVGAFRTPDAPAAWEMTVYAEDVASHSLYCSPANRFYECLQMGLPQAIDARAARTLTQAGFYVDDYVVDSQKDVKKLLRRASEIALEQRNRWWRRFDQLLRNQFNLAREESFG